jgi:hypothetical protein
MKSSTDRPLDVICQPPLMRFISPCEKMSRSETRAARRLVRSAQSRPPVAKIGHVPLEVLHDGEAIRIADRDLEDRHLEMHARRRATSAVVGAREGIAVFRRGVN